MALNDVVTARLRSRNPFCNRSQNNRHTVAKLPPYLYDALWFSPIFGALRDALAIASVSIHARMIKGERRVGD
jgi:hypothetical protein